MTIRVGITHETRYRYDRRVRLSPQVIRLRPAVHSRTPIHSYSLRIEGGEHFLNWHQDPFGNFLARAVFPEPVEQLGVIVDLVADLTVFNPFDFFLEEAAEKLPFTYEEGLRRDLAPYLETAPAGPLLEKWLAGIDRTPSPTVPKLVEINQQLMKRIEYSVRMEPGVQTPEETLGRGIGSCRDSGWLLVQILRHLGLAARFVSGYLVQLVADEKPLEGPSGTSADFTDLHAWAEVFVPGAGWIGLDPTSGLFAGEGHIPLACTPNPRSAAPIEGASDPCEVEFEYRNVVRRVHEDPRVTRPYDRETWARIDELGNAVDRKLEAGDVRLTLGGEPTFVSTEDRDAPEWNTEANGVAKLAVAEGLFRRMRDRAAPGSLPVFGQGKWYPGEALPRWALSCFWRRDGEPIWSDDSRIAFDAPEAGAPGAAGPAEAERFAVALRELLEQPEEHLLGAFEDPVYYAWREGRLPANVAVDSDAIDDPRERARLVRLLDEERLGSVSGWVLPLRFDEKRECWRSSAWPLRRERLFLHPGDSPVGFRLPLESIPWEAPEAREPVVERSLFAEQPPLPGAVFPAASKQAPERAAEPEPLAHTAVCVEARGGIVHVFLPPAPTVEAWLGLVRAVEDAAKGSDLAIRIEGYDPPRDPRLERFAVTPDPGVIEVNVHPARNWPELCEIVRSTYEDARQEKLVAEKFLVDGRHTGTGGGNHVTLGGATPADSPMLRRPELLGSLLTYWQHHPGLSYLFSGLFIGPTSQAPRIDEGRDDALYELELALAEMPSGDAANYWLVDRLFRNLLVDVSGNTHRAEFSIDKLFSPDSETGRLGLLELRAFEMPPHAEMSLVQMVLLRSLVARFWETPYRKPLVRWGTELHDRFLLPHYVAADVQEVCEELREAGFDFDPSWLDPFVEFRFPLYGRMQVGDLEVELRQGLEPWPVLGEEAYGGSTSRGVDSSVERLQVLVRGTTSSRFVVTCNGRPLPLRPTGTAGEAVAGLRFRAWHPPSALHPTIGVHSPLVFDVVDTWNDRSLGGCTYHVHHPGGRSYDGTPVNAFEAEARRVARFFSHGHSPGVVTVAAEAPNPEHPHTLDLRRRPA